MPTKMTFAGDNTLKNERFRIRFERTGAEIYQANALLNTRGKGREDIYSRSNILCQSLTAAP